MLHFGYFFSLKKPDKQKGSRFQQKWFSASKQKIIILEWFLKNLVTQKT